MTDIITPWVTAHPYGIFWFALACVACMFVGLWIASGDDESSGDDEWR